MDGIHFEKTKLSEMKILQILVLRTNNTRRKTIAFNCSVNLKPGWRILYKLSGNPNLVSKSIIEVIVLRVSGFLE